MVLSFIFDTVGFGEWFMLLAVVLIVVGPKRLPSIAREIGKWYGKFMRAAENFKREIMELDQEATKRMEGTFSFEGDEGAVIPKEIDT
ncbi:MAG: twin-arginine translocase TatA/TatE family subunit [Kiritimatiellae bacterium]|nr:twin-arginine translocase TatA/TatE family subunit [Kiritimatiellia bacterium]